MNLSFLLIASVTGKIIGSVLAGAVGWAAENWPWVSATLGTIFTVIAGIFGRKKPGDDDEAYTDEAEIQIRRRHFLRRGAIALGWFGGLGMAAAFGRATMNVRGQVRGESKLLGYIRVLELPEPKSGAFVEAESSMADQGGHFSTCQKPGVHRYFFFKQMKDKQGKDTLYFSVAVRNKGWLPANEEFELNADSMPFQGVVVDRFSFSKDAVPSDGQKSISTFVNKRKANRESWYVVIGHTDKTGPSFYNDHLGKSRAREAAQHLLSLGVSADQIIITSFGEDCLTGADDAALDRRIEVFVISNPYVAPAEKNSKVLTSK